MSANRSLGNCRVVGQVTAMPARQKARRGAELAQGHALAVGHISPGVSNLNARGIAVGILQIEGDLHVAIAVVGGVDRDEAGHGRDVVVIGEGVDVQPIAPIHPIRHADAVEIGAVDLGHKARRRVIDHGRSSPRDQGVVVDDLEELRVRGDLHLEHASAQWLAVGVSARLPGERDGLGIEQLLQPAVVDEVQSALIQRKSPSTPSSMATSTLHRPSKLWLSETPSGNR